jgi:glucose/mannose-6-phosphate isomerase
MTTLDLDRLDDPAGLETLDPAGMLRAVATSGAQVRASLTAAREASLAPIAPDARPRGIVVAGMGGSGISGDVLAAIAAPTSAVPVVVHRGYGLPAWVGAADLVVAVSCSGTTAETLSSAVEAARRGSRLLGVGSEGSPLDLHCRSEAGAFIPITPQLSPRSSMWALAVPLLVVAARFGLIDLADADLAATADRLDELAEMSRLDRESFVNPAKTLATELAGSLPMIWGSGLVGPVTAYRAACQLAENAKLPALWGALPEAHHNQSVIFDNSDVVGDPDLDLFRDRVDEPEPQHMRLVLVRDDAGDELAARRAESSAEVAQARGIAVTTLTAEGGSAVERLASLVGLIDFASVYLALARGVDPTPIVPIDELKALIAR